MEQQTLLMVVTATLVSPLVLKIVEFVFSKTSEREKDVQSRLEALGRRVDELRDMNTQQSIKMGVQQAKIETQEKEIKTLQQEVRDRDDRIEEMQEQIDTLRAINKAQGRK